MEGSSPASPEGASWDLLAEELQGLRTRVGNPSYAAVAQLVTDRRVAQGVSPHAARIARSTVYDCFRTGRSRVNLSLVREIALVLGADNAQVDEWFARCHAPAPAFAPAPSAETEEPAGEEAPAQLVTGEEKPAPTAVSLRQACLLLAACVALNMVGRVLVDFLHLPIYLDMAGTAIAAIALGAWRGASVGVATNVLGVASSGLVSLAFIPVNVAGALVWGYGLHRFSMGRTLQRFFLLNVLAALTCTVVAVPILYFAYDGFNGNGTDVITQTVESLTGVTVIGVAVANVLTSLADKVMSGFVVLVAVASLPEWWRRTVPLVFVGGTDAPTSTAEELAQVTR